MFNLRPHMRYAHVQLNNGMHVLVKMESDEIEKLLGRWNDQVKRGNFEHEVYELVDPDDTEQVFFIPTSQIAFIIALSEARGDRRKELEKEALRQQGGGDPRLTVPGPNGMRIVR